MKLYNDFPRLHRLSVGDQNVICTGLTKARKRMAVL